ncbi:MAG: penicillin-binding protein 2 [Parcubacteria group bacterium]
MKLNFLTRIRIISVCIFLFALILIGRLYVLQIVDNDVYLDKADRQYSSSSKGIFSRGSIFFRNKDNTLVSAATLKSGYTITINPQILKDPETVYQKLKQIFELDHEVFMAKALKKGDPYEEIAIKQSEDVGKKVESLKIAGLKPIKERWRFYPGGKTASNVVGLLGFKGNEYAGRYGLERQFDKNLERKDGAYVNFFAEVFSDIKKVTATDDSMEADIVTTIEPTVQSQLEDVLAKMMEKWNSESAGGIVMDPKTGEIYAMAVNPSFDPNRPEIEKNVAVFSNNLVESRYEMGSIIKAITVASGIDAGVITSKSTYYDKGFVMISGKKISNFDSKERGVVSMQDLLSQSLNVGAAYVESLLGNKRFSDYMYKFGVGEKTGIELPNEGRNLTDNLKSNVDVNLATASFGQGIALTPVSTIRALAVVANGGLLVKPHIVKGINYKMGMSKDIPVEPGIRVISENASSEVTRMMVHSMDKVLVNGTLSLPNYSVAVKTGTAQIAKEGGGGYIENGNLHSFIGYFPAYNPKFIILLYMIKPVGAKYGSETLPVPFTDMVKFLINYYEVPPDR